MAPACVSTCQPQALRFGTREEMLAYGQERVEVLRGRGSPTPACTAPTKSAVRTCCTC